MKFTFCPEYTEVDTFCGLRDEQTIKREAQLFSCDLKHARQLGGPLTNEILDRIEKKGLPKLKKDHTWIVDTRVHMLMPGFWPAIPGWHCDAIQRDKITGQPDLMNSPMDCNHYTCLMESEPNVSPTQFFPLAIDIDVDETAVWKSVSLAVNRFRDENPGKMYESKAGTLIAFTGRCLHTASEAKTFGWRFFFRLSEMKTTPRNEIRTQTQVYADVNGGW